MLLRVASSIRPSARSGSALIRVAQRSFSEQTQQTPAKENVEANTKRKFKDSDKRRQKKKEAMESKKNTQICAEYQEKGSCSKPNCTFAHGLAELKPQPFIALAAEQATAEKRPVTADDLVNSRIESIMRRKFALSDILNNLNVSKEVVSSVVFSNQTLDYTRMVQKVAIGVPVSVLADQWHLNPEQVDVLKRVVGPRYNPDTGTFRLVKRNRAPFTQMLNDATVYDPLIQKLVVLVNEVKKATPPPFAFETDVVPCKARPVITVQPVSDE